MGSNWHSSFFWFHRYTHLYSHPHRGYGHFFFLLIDYTCLFKNANSRSMYASSSVHCRWCLPWSLESSNICFLIRLNSVYKRCLVVGHVYIKSAIVFWYILSRFEMELSIRNKLDHRKFQTDGILFFFLETLL